MSTQPYHVVVVEDDPAQMALIRNWLKTAGYRLTTFDNGAQAKYFFETESADIVILDWDLPEVSGERLLRWLRGRLQSSLPVIFQTVHQGEEDIANILDAGADDYLVKPYERTVFLARIRAVLRRYRSAFPIGDTLDIAGVILDQKSRTMACGEARITLGVKEFDIAWYLANRMGKTVLRQELLSSVWGIEAHLETRSVDMYVSRLRTKLRDIAANEWRVQSIYGIGYRFDLARAEDVG